jgi:(S)-ureidoglycine aminohydrolase
VEYELFIEPGGKTLAPLRQAFQHFFYLLDGGLTLECNGKAQAIEPGCFAWLPPQATFSFHNPTQAQTRMVWIRKPYEQAPGIEIPAEIIRHESEIPANPTDTYMEQHLTPYEDIAFDMGINLQVFEPGVYFSFAETHIMEHGLYMLYGRGIYWLNGDFMEVQKEDFIYMAPFCPQFYYATGWEKSAYLLYKDVNRDYAAQL